MTKGTQNTNLGMNIPLKLGLSPDLLLRYSRINVSSCSAADCYQGYVCYLLKNRQLGDYRRSTEHQATHTLTSANTPLRTGSCMGFRYYKA